MLRELADVVEALPHYTKPYVCYGPADPFDAEGFNMVDWVADRQCGTACCLAGWAVALWSDEEEYEKWDSIFDQARDLLGLSDAEAQELFDPEMAHLEACLTELGRITPKQAADCLRLVANHHPPEEAWQEVLVGQE